MRIEVISLTLLAGKLKMTVEYLHFYTLEMNISEVSTVLVALENRVIDYEDLLRLCSINDDTSRDIFQSKIIEMNGLIERLKGL